MKIKSLLISALFSASVICPNMTNVDEVHAEATYSMELSIDTLELPRNWIEPNYQIEVPVRVSNNPGVTYLTFMVRKSDNVPGYMSATYHREKIAFSDVGTSPSSENPNVTQVVAFGRNVYYDANDVLCYIKISIPQGAEIGDFYSLEFAPECVEDGNEFGFKKDGAFYNEENFSVLNGGGVRIVDDRPKYGEIIQPSTPENNNEQRDENNEPQNNEQPAVNENNSANNNDNSDNKNDSNGQNNRNENPDKGNNANKTDKKEDVTTQKGTTLTKTKSTTSTTISGSDKKTTVLSETTGDKVKETKANIVEKNNEETEEEKKNNHIPEFFISGIVSAGVIIFLLIQNISKKKK